MKVGDRVEVVEGTEDGGDDHLIGKRGYIRQLDEHYAEVELDGMGTDTYQFGTYQLKVIT